MAAIFAFTCSCCGKVHEGSPSVGYDAPWHYWTLNAEQKASLGKLGSDFWTITHEEGTDYFVRTILEVPIRGVSDPFTWGVWVSLSEKSFARYAATFDEPRDEEGYFGWFSNRLPLYADTINLASDVRVQLGRKRPKLVLHREASHQLQVDQTKGISIARAQELAEYVSHKA